MACDKETAIVEEQPAGEEQQIEIKGNEVVIEIPKTPETKAEPKPEEVETVEEIDAPEIKGENFNFVFDQESKKYINEETNQEVGAWVEDAVKINGEMSPAIILEPEAITKILEENKEKGIFKCPWPFNFQENKGIEMVELIENPSYEQLLFKKIGGYLPRQIGIKYSKPIGFHATVDFVKSMGHIVEYIPGEAKGPDFYSTQPFKNISFGNENLGGLQYNFIDWEPEIELSNAEIVGNNSYLQNILQDIKCGDFLGKILPNTTDFNFLDFCDNKEFYKNPGQFQGRLLITDFSDDFSEKTSSLDKMLRYKNKAGQEIPVGFWSEENTAHEQNK